MPLFNIYTSRTPPLYTSAVYTLSSYPLSPFLFSKKFLCTSLGKRRVTCLFGPQNYQHFFFFCSSFLFVSPLCRAFLPKSALRSLWWVGGVSVHFLVWCTFGGVCFCSLQKKPKPLKGSVIFCNIFWETWKSKGY